MSSVATLYICPLCQQSLSLVNKVYSCTTGHCFDQAKEGYVNLLPVQLKHSKNPGDNKQMVRSRREFLSSGYYQPLADKLSKTLSSIAELPSQATILDAGCGEGFYSHQLGEDNLIYGVDISKEAIKLAAKKYKTCHFSVATLSHLPFANHSFNGVVSIYAPIIEQEFKRVLSENGFLITVTPAKNHLHELKALIYDNAKPHDDEKIPVSSLTLFRQETLTYELCIKSAQHALSLLEMTPFAFKKSDNLLKQLSLVSDDNPFTCQADFLIRLYQKQSNK